MYVYNMPCHLADGSQKPFEGRNVLVAANPVEVRVGRVRHARRPRPDAVHHRLKRGGQRGDADARCTHHDILILREVLRGCAVRAVDQEQRFAVNPQRTSFLFAIQLGVLFVDRVAGQVHHVLRHLRSPALGALHTDVERDVLFMRGRRDGHGVPLELRHVRAANVGILALAVSGHLDPVLHQRLEGTGFAKRERTHLGIVHDCDRLEPGRHAAGDFAVDALQHIKAARKQEELPVVGPPPVIAVKKTQSRENRPEIVSEPKYLELTAFDILVRGGNHQNQHDEQQRAGNLRKREYHQRHRYMYRE